MKQPEYTEGKQALENFKGLASAILTRGRPNGCRKCKKCFACFENLDQAIGHQVQLAVSEREQEILRKLRDYKPSDNSDLARRYWDVCGDLADWIEHGEVKES